MEHVSAEQVRRCVMAYGRPGERSSPKSPTERAALRGDHSLDPSLFEADQALRDAAVLVPIVEREIGLALLLTRRADHLHHYAGQISFRQAFRSARGVVKTARHRSTSGSRVTVSTAHRR